MNPQKARKIIKLKKKLAAIKGLGFIQVRLLHKDLWRLSYGSAARASMIDVFWMMIPIPMQMIPAIMLCVYLLANIPLVMACIWLSNPFTWLPMYFGNYLLGSYLLGMSVNITDWHSYATYLVEHIDQFWQPLYLGSVVGGFILGGISYCGIYLFKYTRDYFVNEVCKNKGVL